MAKEQHAVVSLTPPGVDRAAVEAARGIVRDETGDIIRTPEWHAERVEALQAKRSDLVARIKNIDAKITEHKKAAKSK